MSHHLAQLASTVSDAVSAAVVPGGELVDTVGELDRLITQLRDYRALLMSEIASGDTGQTYRAIESRSATRSYNTDKLLLDVMRRLSAAADLSHAVGYLREADAVRLTWRWTELQRVARDLDLTLSIAKHQIEGGDPATHIGEVWGSTVRVEPIEGGSRG
jgi:predicted NAD/FAD-binding protein